MSQVLQIRIADYTSVEDDDLGRESIGYFPGITPEDAWEAGRGVWRLDVNRIIKNGISLVRIINTKGLILAEAYITGFDRYGDRVALNGVLLKDSPNIGKITEVEQTSRNSVAYIEL